MKDPDVYITRGHGKAFSGWEMSILKNKVSKPATLIHFDSHSDMNQVDMAYPKSKSEVEAFNVEYGITSFIVPAVYHNYVSEIYWVLPIYHEHSETKNTFFSQEYIHGESDFAEFARSDVKSMMLNVVEFFKPGQQNQEFKHVYFTVQADANPAIIAEYVEKGFRVKTVRNVMVHKLLASELPDFGKNKNPIILSIDEDYFWMDRAGIGHPSLNKEGDPASEKFKNKILGYAKETVDTISDKNINPQIITISLSPDFTPNDVIQPLTEGLLNALSESPLVTPERDPKSELIIDNFSLNGSVDSILNNYSSKKPMGRISLIRTLRNTGQEMVIRALSDRAGIGLNDVNIPVQLETIKAIGYLGKSLNKKLASEALKPMLLNQENKNVRHRTAYVLSSLAPPGLEVLREGARSTDSEIKSLSLEALRYAR